MWEWWRAVEREYREKRGREDGQRQEERRERARRRTPQEAQMEASRYAPWTTEELLAEAERRWGTEVDWEELGMARPRPRGVQVVVEIGGKSSQRKGHEDEHDELAEGALLLVLTGKWKN
jgi:hypothetical protein